MSGSNGTINSIKGLSSLEKARFGPGMLLRHDDLEQLNLYTRDLSRLLFRSFFGCGVICGLVVKVGDNCGKVCITVGAGVGIDCTGDPIHVPKDVSLSIDEKCDPNLEGPLWVILCPSKTCCAPRSSSCGCEDDEKHPECTRERVGYEIRVVSTRPKCACGCVNPEVDECKPGYTPEGKEAGNDAKSIDEDPCRCVKPTPHSCYSDHYNGLCGCACEADSDCSCGCDCIVLARLCKEPNETKWKADHRVRRFVRPVLMRDPQVVLEKQPTTEAGDVVNSDVLLAVTAKRKKRGIMKGSLADLLKSQS